MVIAHNLTAMNAQRQYGIVTSSKAKSTEKLSSGYKINRAADDAAGLTISEKMRSQIRGLNQGSANIQDGVSLVQIADGALAEVNDMLHRMTELSIKSANGTNTSEDRVAIQKEIHQIIQEIDRIHESTEFNTMKLFDGLDKGTAPKEKLTKLITTAAGQAGYLTENFVYGGYDHASAKLDFSNINARNVKKIYDKGFSFTCSASCGETFEFKLVNGGGSGKTEVGSTHLYTVDIKGLTNGKDIAKKIWDTVVANPTSWSVSASAPAGTQQVGHANGLLYNSSEPSKLLVFTTMDRQGPETFKPGGSKYGSPYGKVNCSGLDEDEGKVKNFWIQASGSSPDDGMKLEVSRMDAEYIGIIDVDVSTQDGAKDAIDVIKDATSMISAMRSDLGAYQNRLEHAYANNMNKAENTTAAESRIRDTDMAEMMMKFTKDNILAQATEAMMAQANQSTQGVLSLLQ